MTAKVVVGVYLERTGGAVMRAVAEQDKGQKQIVPTHFEEVNWNPGSVTEARAGVEAMANAVAQIEDCKSIAIASYGPFEAIRRVDSDDKYTKPKFGIIDSKVAHLPLRGFDLRRMFSSAILAADKDREFLITIHTDAEACAIGEGLARGIKEDKTLAYLLVTEGIGLGVVQGQQPLRSALHSEMGMLHVRRHSKDKIATKREIDPWAVSLSEMASNEAMRSRFRTEYKLPPKMDVTNDIVKSDPKLKNWYMRAYYISQACFACSVILAPHKIIIGTDLDRDEEFRVPDIATLTELHFRKFLNARMIDKQPVFTFEELDKRDYIERSVAIPSIREKPSFRATGALGMCYAAETAPSIVEKSDASDSDS